MNIKETLEKFLNRFNDYSKDKSKDKFKDNTYYKKAKNILSHESLNVHDYRNLHHNLCKLMFHDVKQGKEVWIQIDDIYSSNENLDSENPKNFVRVSLLNQNMLDYDRNMFQLLSSENEYQELARNVFRPYFLHFLIDVTKIDEKSITFISNPENLGQWFKGEFLQKENVPDMMENLMEGLIESSASPVHYEKHTLIIKNIHLGSIILKEINDTYDAPSIGVRSDKYVNNELKHIFNNTKFSKVRVYNVGNGNCIYIKGLDGKKPKNLLYDIGYHNHFYPRRVLGRTSYQRSIHAIRSFSKHLDCIILSHWDLDHILGCAHAPQYLFHRKWIAPNFPPKERTVISARRLAVYLDRIGSLILVDRNPTPQRTNAFACLTDQTSKSTISFWIGNGLARRIPGVKRKKADSRISKINREGIIIEIANINHHGKNTNCLLSGDVPYSSMPNGVNLITNKSPLDYLVVPHHGSNMDFNELNVAPQACAIISAAGVNNLPHDEHKEALKTKGYQTFITHDVGLYIEVSLLTPNVIKTVNPIP